MLEIRTSQAAKESRQMKKLARKSGESNSAWLARAGVSHGDALLLGGANLTHFRLRVAQADIRRDLLPSSWSHVVIVDASVETKDWRVWEVSLEGRDDVHLVPKTNGVRQILLSAYDDPKDFPNIARLHIPPKQDDGELAKLPAHVRKFQMERLSLNVPALMVEWYAWVWGVTEGGNPLKRSMGIPSAVFVESIFGLMGIELTPGLASRSSCPEAIWQSARWWHEFYASESSLSGPIEGVYCVDQPDAAVLDTRNAGEDRQVQRSLRVGGVGRGGK
jgi:hypothetical protein